MLICRAREKRMSHVRLLMCRVDEGDD